MVVTSPRINIYKTTVQDTAKHLFALRYAAPNRGEFIDIVKNIM